MSPAPSILEQRRFGSSCMHDDDYDDDDDDDDSHGDSGSKIHVFCASAACALTCGGLHFIACVSCTHILDEPYVHIWHHRIYGVQRGSLEFFNNSRVGTVIFDNRKGRDAASHADLSSLRRVVQCYLPRQTGCLVIW
uniref:Uncharacterized protein n=1 Tax=Bigelowiella natans TaxID=227086 RepID=A0A7S2P5S9_BIGNA